MKKSSIGGQGVLEGVMMRSETCTGIAVRRDTGILATQKTETTPLSERGAAFRIPVVRGICNFVGMLYYGVKTITDAAKLYDPEMAAEEFKPNKAEQLIAKKTGKSDMDVAMFFAVVIALVIAVLLFVLLPNFLAGLLDPVIQNDILKNIIDGLIRLGIFFIYLFAITFIPDIKRLFAYHGAEHKVINCYEHEKDMTVENAQTFTTRHPRCGTSYLLIVMIISIFVFCLFGWQENVFIRVGIRICLLPVVAGIAYEVLKLLAKYENKLTCALRAPGLGLQAITTREPDDSMIEAALLAFYIAEGTHSDEEIQALADSYSRKKEDTKEENVDE